MLKHFRAVVVGVVWVAAAASVVEAAPVLVSDSRFAQALRQVSPPNGADGTVEETLTDAQPHSQFKIVSANVLGFSASSRADVTSAYLPPAGGGGAVAVGGAFGGLAISSGQVFTSATATSVGNTALSRGTWEANAVFTTDTPVEYTFSGDRRATLTGVGAAIDYRAELRNDSTGGTLVFRELAGGAFAYTDDLTGIVGPGTYHLRIYGAAQNFFASGDALGTGSGNVTFSDVQLGLVTVPEPGAAVGLLGAVAVVVGRSRRGDRR